MNAKVGSFPSLLSTGLPLPKETGTAHEPALKKSGSHKSLGGPAGLGSRNPPVAQEAVAGNRAPRSGLPGGTNELQNNPLFKKQQLANNADAQAATPHHGLAVPARASFKASSSLQKNALFLKQQALHNAEAASHQPPAAAPHQSGGFKAGGSLENLQDNPLFLKQQLKNNPDAAPTAPQSEARPESAVPDSPPEVPQQKAEVSAEPEGNVPTGGPELQPAAQPEARTASEPEPKDASAVPDSPPEVPEQKAEVSAEPEGKVPTGEPDLQSAAQPEARTASQPEPKDASTVPDSPPEVPEQKAEVSAEPEGKVPTGEPELQPAAEPEARIASEPEPKDASTVPDSPPKVPQQKAEVPSEPGSHVPPDGPGPEAANQLATTHPPGADLDVDAKKLAAAGHDGAHGAQQPEGATQADAATQDAIKTQEQQMANQNALTEATMRSQMQAAINDFLVKSYEAVAKWISKLSKSLADLVN
ncbi:hypothetical protein [Paracidovorax konjaci]|uniref:Uncharacterized protein n=1 Tax=Paracidovorax konjaci TaxID=32040 RepID=A0A1I1Z5P0_9BURK|nr:hypothetical protein [Paracidovorax konjaci]SFE26892.1 hypothetical protein SAMN04489710_12324 [Paracidovorax konjaci]